MKTRIAVVDDHPIVLAGLAELIGARSEYEVVATGEDARDIPRVLERGPVDLLLIDLNMPGDVKGTIRALSGQPGAPPVLVFTAAENVEDGLSTLSSGARGYVVKGSSADELFHAMSAVLKGREYISATLAGKVVRAMQRNRDAAEEAAPVKLSHREEQIITHLMQGATNRLIADRLKLSENTIKFYMSQIMQKFEVQSRVEVILAVQKTRGGSMSPNH